MDHDDGVLLRARGPQDEAAVTAAREDRHGRRFLPRGGSSTSDFSYAVIRLSTGFPVGGIDLDRQRADPGAARVTFWIGSPARGLGLGTAALRTLGDHIFGDTPEITGLHRLELLIHQDNPIAQRVALAAGFTREGERRGALPNDTGGYDDVLVYARLAGDPGTPAERLLPDLPGGDLTDGVVTLRPLGEDDIAFYADLHSRPDVVATSVPPIPPEPDEVRRRCLWAPAHWLAGSRADMVIVDTATGAPAGEVSLYYQEPRTGQAMIGYSMLPEFRGRGMTTRAAKLVALWAFAETGIARLIAGTLPDNRGSQRVLEKAGFQREAYLRSRLPGPAGTRHDDVQFVLFAEDLLAQVSGGELTQPG
ncbi:putative GMP synthase [Actinoplanes sp. SE50]|uniref:GNAT family N-acetyltransferase n=1 Tax=unclassified Actinoplanes TaxID=2626549 RepID=UPI00023EC724|nr:MULTISPECIES: GNAT family N-acetyltransferase [unclassified Actinoplanes]AEV81968.1 putative GMP synthase [Actinoplanes sp. SE50/110]ATO80368.1 putative GMP synthase [Actinoplanes sp. SE50]SLL97774.1 GMP synthase [Actinoplanes sp. SE50/110]